MPLLNNLFRTDLVCSMSEETSGHTGAERVRPLTHCAI